MRVEELIIDGFKSYATRTVISGWDSQFNAITGLNGSGKSNILDAICFVLGISSMSTVRASNLQDLIYKRGQAGVTKASVTIVFDNSDTAKSPIGFESIPKISVTRQIVLGGTSKYLINGHRAQQQAVLQLFQSVQLNINNPNFLIMQGKITKVLNMKPSEILSLIEEAAGTKMFEDRKDKAEKTMAKKETKLQEIRSLLIEEIEPKLEKLRNEKRMFLEFQQTQSDLEKLSRVVNAHDFTKFSAKYFKYNEEFETKSSILENSSTEIERLTNEITNLTEDLERFKERKALEAKKGNKLKDLESKQTEINKTITRFNTSRGIISENIKDEESKKQETLKQISWLEKEVESKLTAHQNLEKEYNEAKDKLSELKATHVKKEELLSTLTTGVSSKGKSGGYNQQLQEEKQKLADANVSIQQSKLKVDHLISENNSNKPKLAKAQREHDVFLQEINNLKQKQAGLEDQLTKVGFNPSKVKDLKRREIEINRELHKVNNEANFLKRKVANLEFSYTKPTSDFNSRSVKGVVAQLFNLDESQSASATALEVAAGGRLYNIVVDNEVTGSQLLERGQLRKRITIIPLNKIAARTLSDQQVNIAKELCPGKVELALNLIGYEHEVAKAMEFIFGTRLVCEDAETAKKVTFHPQVRARSVTLQGDVYDPEGTLSGGSRKSSGSVLINIQNYNKVNNHLKSLNNDLKNIQFELAQESELSEKTRSIQNELSLTSHQIQLAEKNLQTNSSSQILYRYENNIKEIEELQNIVQTKITEAEKIGSEISKIENDMKEFSTNRGSKLQELEQEVEFIALQISKLDKQLNIASDGFQSSQIELEQLGGELQTAKESITDVDSTIQDLHKQLATVDKDLSKENEVLMEINAEIDVERENQVGINEEIAELNKVLSSKNKQMNDIKLNSQKLSHEVEKLGSSSKSLRKHLEELIEENSWLEDDNIVQSVIQQYPNVNLDECHDQIARLNERFQGMKRKVNSNIMSMIDNVEKKETALKQMIKTIEKDKSKIEETIVTLNEYKRETLVKTWEKVSTDFGLIFGDLLPSSFSKLVPPEGKDITEGLEVKVRLGKVWKESLVELSGGQRSLIALSLILALLQFKPAPMYILDEVDAALDLSHTQNIGHLIKTRFKGSQFIIVSLKEGMFTNANRVFRTRFQDGTSVVSVM
ncbi:Structural maintenance of chromosomes protein [Wickerhamomyces ciferrii]|uniref:Structural maintenance of chromosomes protein n=1 Tax=Wickerhamomyces ciferrii (strain ATCC 14091 / BCRC 22168 / CBS 111 / JCM 3599 / NBRC 0793 / NRRL Y-1031 F-60-10) TaxID=1206466 RepID=K0KWT7_WICCF|nr:Structural maintenance of chromosomes protein [Wickerhamomyces ciferrii]CCH46502.1 Structural maintenance of chromosomes protein [Wickerhamomyces ciferrii]